MFTVRFAPVPSTVTLAEVTTASLVEMAEKVISSFSESPTVKGIGSLMMVSLGMVWLAIEEMVGAPTVTRKLRLAVLPFSSVTVTEMSAEPC